MIPMKTLKMNEDIFEITDGTARESLNFDKSATQGYILTATNSGNGTQWSPVGLPTDEQTADAVSDWLDNHPEATTTVQDGSISDVKLNRDVLEKVNDTKVYTIGGKIITAKNIRNASYQKELLTKVPRSHYLSTYTEYIWFQSAVYVDSLERVVMAFTTSDYSKGMLVVVDTDFTTVYSRHPNMQIGHANDMAYNPVTDRIYIAPMDTGTNANSVIVVNPSTMTIVDTKPMGSPVYEVSYDADNNIYYVVSSQFKIYDDSFSLLGSATLQNLTEYGISSTNQGSHCIDGNFILASQDSYNTYYKTFDYSTGNVLQYQTYQNNRFGEETEALFDFGGFMYSVSGQAYITVNKYGLDCSSSAPLGENVYNNGVPVASGGDLNDYIKEGKYFSESGTYTSGLSNVPEGCGSGFSLYVINQGKDWLIQVLVENSARKKIFFRTYTNGTFGTWRRNNDTFATGDEIPSGADLDDYLTEGKYYSVDQTRTRTMENYPEECDSGFSLYVAMQGLDWRIQIIIENSNRRRIYFRTYNAGTFGPWRLKNKEAVSSTEISQGGTYQIPSEMLDYDVITISCNKNYYFGSVTASVKAIKKGDLASGIICIADMSHYWTLTVSNAGLITVTGLTGVTAPYIRIIAN